MNVPSEIKELAQAINNAGGTLYVVGGAVRDWIMGNEPVDFDLLIVGLDIDTGLAIMEQPEQVIGNAPVFMWGDTEVAFARREVSTGSGKHAFEFIADPTVTLFDDLERRDFTINAMAWDVLTGHLHDPFKGRSHIIRKLLYPVSPSFVESPERVLRGASFAARFDFEISVTMLDRAEEMFNTFETIPSEQIWRHWVKMCEHAVKPSKWLEFMLITEWLRHFPVLWGMVGVMQDAEYHPEGSVIDHVGQVMDMAMQAADELGVDRVWAITTALLHDAGKTITTVKKDGKIVSPGHAEAGVEIARSFLQQISAPHKFTERVLEGVKLHMRHIDINTKRAVRRLIANMHHITLDELTCIVMADQSGRHPYNQPVLQMPDTMQFIIDNAVDMQIDNGFEPILMGRHLIDLGLQPSKEFGIILNAAQEAQVDGEFDNLTDGLIWLEGYFLKWQVL